MLFQAGDDAALLFRVARAALKVCGNLGRTGPFCLGVAAFDESQMDGSVGKSSPGHAEARRVS